MAHLGILRSPRISYLIIPCVLPAYAISSELHYQHEIILRVCYTLGAQSRELNTHSIKHFPAFQCKTFHTAIYLTSETHRIKTSARKTTI